MYTGCADSISRDELAVAAATGMATSRTCSMPIGTGVAAVVFAIFLNGIISIDNAQTRFTGTFHLSHSSHGSFLRD